MEKYTKEEIEQALMKASSKNGIADISERYDNLLKKASEDSETDLKNNPVFREVVAIYLARSSALEIISDALYELLNQK